MRCSHEEFVEHKHPQKRNEMFTYKKWSSRKVRDATHHLSLSRDDRA